MILVVLSFVFPDTWGYADGPLPDTGQTSCYDNNGNILDPCPQAGESYYGQDANYTINPPSYTKLAYGGVTLPITATQSDGWIMTRDNVTGLVWEIKTDDGSIHDMDDKYTWCDTNPDSNGGDPGYCGNGTDTEDFIAALNTENYGGFSDWRLPTRKEQITIVDYSTHFNFPSIDGDFFPNTQATLDYWSSTSYIGLAGAAWGMDFDSLYDYDGKFSDHYVRAVRGGQPRASDHLIINRDGTVTDTDTGLMWQQQPDHNRHTWEDALDYCENATLAGYTDWRLPTFKELNSIVDLTRSDPAIYPVFIGTNYASYWSSTSNTNSTGNAWFIGIFNGGDYNDDKSYEYNVRAVRGGQVRSFGNLVIIAPKQGATWILGETNTITWETQDITGNVSIALSRDGGQTFSETLSSSEPNNGSFQWMVTGLASYNCMLKITPLNAPGKATTQGLFTIDMDTDDDGISDDNDQCPGYDDAIDVDSDRIPDDCDALIDSDDDGVADSEDICPGYNDSVDVDADGIPDGCDASQTSKQGFDYLSYLSFNADLPQTWSKKECMEHYRLFGFSEQRAVSFNLEEYLNANPDLPSNWTNEEALYHYNLFGKYEKRLLSFSADEYLSLYPDLPQDWTYDQAYAHYIYFGKQEGRIASFDETAYLELYEDLPRLWGQVEAFYHYQQYGKSEGRVYDPYDEDVFINNSNSSSRLPDTGQVTSYTSTFGEDSDYSINPQSYTKLDASGNELFDSVSEWAMVRDNVTGLIWEVKTDDGGIHDKNNYYSKQNARDKFIPQLNRDNFGGYDDWRIPTVVELSMLVDADKYDPSINEIYFKNTMSAYYLSSNGYDVLHSWHVFFRSGTVGNFLYNDYHYFVRAVRGGQ